MPEAVAPAVPFPPTGQGVNGAMESTMTLDQYIGEAGRSPDQFLVAAVRYTGQWMPEASAEGAMQPPFTGVVAEAVGLLVIIPDCWRGGDALDPQTSLTRDVRWLADMVVRGNELVANQQHRSMRRPRQCDRASAPRPAWRPGRRR